MRAKTGTRELEISHDPPASGLGGLGFSKMQQIWMQIQKRQTLPSPRVSTRFDLGGQDLVVNVDDVG